MLGETDEYDAGQLNQLISPSYLRTHSRQGRQSNAV